MLLAWGGNVNAVTHGGQTPLHLAAFFGKSRETIQVAVLFLLKVFKVLKNTTPRLFATGGRCGSVVECENKLKQKYPGLLSAWANKTISNRISYPV